MLATAAVRDEDTSDHHAPKSHPAVGDYKLLYHLERALKRIHGGVVVTTSSTMTESPEWAKRWAELGALGVECEASVIYTMTRLAGIPAAIALTVSDHVLREEPKQPSRELEEKVMEARRLTVRAAYEALRMYAEARED